ncbi:hypothetical protein H4R19_002816, partial [Coemansia spiralis]
LHILGQGRKAEAQGARQDRGTSDNHCLQRRRQAVCICDRLRLGAGLHGKHEQRQKHNHASRGGRRRGQAKGEV